MKRGAFGSPTPFNSPKNSEEELQSITIPTPRKNTPSDDTMEYKYDDYDDYKGYESTEKLLRFLLVEKKLSHFLRDAINEKATTFLESLTSLKEEVGSFLHDDMNDEEHSEDDIRTLVQCVPKSLKQKTMSSDGHWNFPIGSVTSSYTTCRKTHKTGKLVCH